MSDEQVPPTFQETIEGRSNVLIVCDHFGRFVPRALHNLGLPPADLERHIAYDIGIAGVAISLSKLLGAHLVAQRYSRLVIDCNRPPLAASSIPTVSEATVIPGNENLSEEVRLKRRQTVFDPYHQTIANTLDRRKREGRKTILMSLHSFTPLYLNVARPWHVGALYNRDDRVSKVMIQLLRREPGLMVGDNEPYTVDDETDYTIPVHAESRGLLHAGIEIRQDLIGHESGQLEWADRLARTLVEIEARLEAEG